MRPLSVLRPANILEWSDTIETCALTTTAQAFDTPATAGFVAFSGNANFAVSFGTTSASFPTTTSTGSTNSEINPTIRGLPSTAGCTGFSVIGSSAGGVVSMAFYGRGGG